MKKISKADLLRIIIGILFLLFIQYPASIVEKVKLTSISQKGE